VSAAAEGGAPALRSLYVCYLSLEDPLVETQVVAYLEGLAARGHTIHLLTFEPRLSEARERELCEGLERRGIAWHRRRYHKRPSLPATFFDVIAGALAAVRIARRHRLTALHARSHVPAAMGLIARRLAGLRLIFDIRGLLAEEYVDAGRWRRGGLAHRITDRVQAAAIRRADGIVVLTERVRRHLFGEEGGAVVIPCCADLSRLASDPEGERRVRDELSLGARPLLAYVGKLTEPYMDREMAGLFAAARAARPELAFLVLTQAPPETMAAELDRAGVAPEDYRITRAPAGDLGAYLGAAEQAISFCRPSFARIASSPTKIGEYLAAGLPVISTAGIGDIDATLAERRVGVLAERLDADALAEHAEEIRELAAEPDCAERCRSAARELFSLEEVGIPRYDGLYRDVARLAS
jgi:glycosyltransferase involved in cell wall biosynthesis